MIGTPAGTNATSASATRPPASAARRASAFSQLRREQGQEHRREHRVEPQVLRVAQDPSGERAGDRADVPADEQHTAVRSNARRLAASDDCACAIALVSSITPWARSARSGDRAGQDRREADPVKRVPRGQQQRRWQRARRRRRRRSPTRT